MTWLLALILAAQSGTCEEFSIDPITITAACFDDGEYYDRDHHAVVPDARYENGFYLVVWR
jgi:hypothetical protein